MNKNEQFAEELDDTKTNKIERVLDAAFELFSTRGIDSVAMTDIANKSKIGVASLYRYFETKEILAVKTATQAWTKRMAPHPQ